MITKYQYYESTYKELHSNIFRSLEIEQYFQKILKDNGFNLHYCKINFSKSVINIFLSVCKLKQVKLTIEEKQRVTKSQIPKKIRKCIKKQHVSKKEYLQTLKSCKKLRLEKKASKIKFTNLSEKMLKSLMLFTQNKQNVNITIKEINFLSDLYVEKTNIGRPLENLYKFKSASFFEIGGIINTPFITQENSSRLLAEFIATQLRTNKRQNFFFNFLKESLVQQINQKFSKLQGIKILITGRINNASRSRNYQIKIGNISLISTNSKIDYSESTAFTQNGTIGIKVWVSKKLKT